jgi:hypothetical protein
MIFIRRMGVREIYDEADPGVHYRNRNERAQLTFTEKQRCHTSVEFFGEDDSLFQQLFGGGLVGFGQESRDMH